MLHKDAAAAEALRLGEGDVVLLQHLQHRGAGHPHEDRGHRQAESDRRQDDVRQGVAESVEAAVQQRSEEHTSELQSLMRISYAVFCLKKKKNTPTNKIDKLI